LLAALEVVAFLDPLGDGLAQGLLVVGKIEILFLSPDQPSTV